MAALDKQPISENELLMMIRQLNLAGEGQSAAPHVAEGSPGAEETNPLRNFVWVENNRIRSSFELPEGSLPLVEGEPPVVIVVNGRPVEEPTTIGPEDVVEWTVAEQPLFHITVSEDQICAYLTVHKRERHGWRLTPTKPGRRLVVKAEPDPSIVTESIDIHHVVKALHELGVVISARTDAIYEALHLKNGTPILIAEGLRPVPSENAKLELYFSEQVERSLREVNGQVDFRNVLHIPSASKGDVVARKLPPKPGIPGYNIFGETIHPAPPKDIFIVGKGNVKITEEGEVIALRDGRPRITGDRIKFFDIAPSYVVPGDVDLSTGNIVFAGDVIVYGDVTDGMIVESLGNVYVGGNVHKATITATGSIVLRGNTATNSNLYSGYFGVAFNRLYIALKAMLDQLQHFASALQQLLTVLERRGMEVPLHQAAMTLIETKFRELPGAAKELEQSIYSVIQLNSAELEEVAALIHVFTKPMHLIELKQRGQLDTMLHRIQEAFGMIERHQENDAFIDLHQANGSTLMATGNVIVRKEGVVQTDIQTKGNIMFSDPQAACRGGVLTADGSIHLGTAGAESGSQTTIRAGKRISAALVRNCLIQVDRFKKTVLAERHNFEAFIEKNRFVIRSDEHHEPAEESSSHSV